jgi:hypothetical protein
MTADEIKALVERLKSKRKMHLANASDIECLDALETLTLENQRLRLEFRADCEKHAEELFALGRENQRLRADADLLTQVASCSRADPNGKKPWTMARRWITVNVPGELMDKIDAGRPQIDKEKP